MRFVPFNRRRWFAVSSALAIATVVGVGLSAFPGHGASWSWLAASSSDSDADTSIPPDIRAALANRGFYLRRDGSMAPLRDASQKIPPAHLPAYHWPYSPTPEELMALPEVKEWVRPSSPQHVPDLFRPQ